MGYKIIYTSKDQFYNMATMKFNRWADQLTSMQKRLNAISNLQCFQGEAAESVKSYFDEIHGFLLLSLRQTINDFYSRLAVFTFGYYNIDAHNKAVLPEEAFPFLKQLATSEQNYLFQEYDSIGNTLSSISDILPLGNPSQDAILNAFESFKSDLTALDQSIAQYETAKQSEANGPLSNLISAMSSAITTYTRSDGGISGYHTGGYASSPEMKALFTQLEVSLKQTTENNKAISDFLKEDGTVAAGLDAKERIQPDLPSIVDLVDQSNVSVSDMIQSGLFLALSGAYVGSVGLSIEKSASQVWDDLSQSDKRWSDAVIKGATVGKGEFLGINTGGYATGDILGASAGYDTVGEFSIKFDENGHLDKNSSKVKIGVKGDAEGHVAHGEVAGNIGYLNGGAEGTFLTGGAKGEVGLTIIDDGKFTPSVYGELGVEGSVLEGKADAHFGSDDNNIHADAEGALLTGKAGVEGGAGRIKIKDEATGKEEVIWGVKGEAKAEAYLAEGSVSGGISILGVDIDIELEGKAGGGGVGAGGYVGTGGVCGELDVGFLVGAGVKIEVDWSDFKLPKWPW